MENIIIRVIKPSDGKKDNTAELETLRKAVKSLQAENAMLRQSNIDLQKENKELIQLLDTLEVVCAGLSNKITGISNIINC